MSVPKSILAAKGLWSGKSQLNLPFLPAGKEVTESDSHLHIETDRNDTFATVTYRWSHEDKPQEGTLILIQDPETRAVQFGWVDSWHQSSSVMLLKGAENATGTIKAKGSFPAGKETWGWTMEFVIESDHLTINMDNLTPAGEPTWAVKATYRRDV